MKRSSVRVLVVDDTQLYHELLSLILRHEGIQVESVYNGHEALIYLQSHEPPALIILDLEMPVMDGREFCRHRECDERFRSIPVLLYSSRTEHEMKSLPVTCWLSKETPPNKLLEQVRQLLPLSSFESREKERAARFQEI